MQSETKLKGSPALTEKLGRYEIVASLGKGGMAEVFLAVQRGAFSSNKLVVIKRLKSDAGGDKLVIDMFVDEARIAMRLSHPNVLSTFDFVADGDDFYLTNEFLDGHSMWQTIRTAGREKMPLDLHIWILTQVLAGLTYAHELRDFNGTPLEIVHRDVTPSNVMLTYSGGVKLVDFGIAKVVGAVSVTVSGTMKGKLGYVSPEQSQGRPTTPRSDLFSVGVMLWEAMARKRRAVGETPAAVYQARIMGTEPSIEEVWPEAPPKLAAIVRRAVATAPEDRYASALEFHRDLDEYLSSRPPTSFGTRALAEFMTRHFAEARESLHRIIDTRLAEIARGTVVSAVPTAAMGPANSEKESWTSGSSKESSTGKALGATTGTAPSTTAAPSLPVGPGTGQGPAASLPYTNPRVIAAVGAVVLVAVVVLVAINSGSSSGPVPAPAAVGQAEGPKPLQVEHGAPVAAPVRAEPSPSPSAPPPLPPPVAQPAGPTVVPLGASRASASFAIRPGSRTKPRGRFPARPGAPADAFDGQEGPRGLAGAADSMPDGRSRSAPAIGGDASNLDESPGMDLRRRSKPAGGARHIDEKDPYTP